MTRTLAIRAAAVLLGAGCVSWAATPLVPKGVATLALILALGGIAGGALRLLLAGVPVPEDSFLLPAPLRFCLWFLQTLRRVPWRRARWWPCSGWRSCTPPAMAHRVPRRGGHRLSAGHAPGRVRCFPVVLRPQVRVLAIGAALLALGAGAGMLPATGPGAGSAVLRLLAAARSSSARPSSCPTSPRTSE